MRKKRRLLLAVLLTSVILGGCAKSQPELPAAVGESAAEEVISQSMQLLESHRDVMGNAKEATIYVEGKEATVPSDVLMELLSYSQWREIESSQAGASVIVAVQDDELSVYENGAVRLGRGNESGWYQVPLEVVMDLKEIFEVHRIPTDEDFVFDEEWMWNNYFYETITSIGNAKHFGAEDLSEIDEIIEYVWYRYSLNFLRGRILRLPAYHRHPFDQMQNFAPHRKRNQGKNAESYLRQYPNYAHTHWA